jgi:hypothetical protein
MLAPLHTGVRTRLIAESDLSAVMELLAKGFDRRSPAYWSRGLDIMGQHPHPPELPRFGYLLEYNGRPVGVLLLISTTIRCGGSSSTRCNVSSWYVDPAFRCYATFLALRATSDRNITYLQISPRPHVRQIIEAQGFVRYTSGQFVTSAWPTRGSPRAEVFEAGGSRDLQFDSSERELLLAHAKYRCISLWCETSTDAHPFVFLPRRVKGGLVPCAQLIYCRSIEDFVRFKGPIASFLALRGRPLIIIDSNGSVPGLAGMYFDSVAPKYFKGPGQPRLGDLAYTEAAIFGM